MNEWYVKDTDSEHKMLIICPVCAEWYEIPRSLEELKCYRYCPWCGESMFVGKKTMDFFQKGE